MYNDQFRYDTEPTMDYSPGCEAAVVTAQRNAYERKAMSEQMGFPTYYATRNGILQAENRPPMRRLRVDQREPPSIYANRAPVPKNYHVERFEGLGDLAATVAGQFSAEFVTLFVIFLFICVVVLMFRVNTLTARVEMLVRGGGTGGEW